MARLIRRLDLGGHRVLDRHGGLIRSTIARRESHRRGRLMALGDAVSTANLLGGEGIRHAMTSSQLLAPLLAEALRHPARAEHLIDAYPRRLRRALGWRWGLSGRLARRTWLGLRDSKADRRLDGLLRGLERKNRAEDLSALLFDYRFERYGLRAVPDLLGWR
jgi:flavin-dependent dehydrogenase